MKDFLSQERSPEAPYITTGLCQVPSNREIAEQLSSTEIRDGVRSQDIMYQSVLAGEGETPKETLKNLDVTLRAYSEEAKDGISRHPDYRINNFEEIEEILESTEEAVESAEQEVKYWEVKQRKNNHQSLKEAFEYIDRLEVPLKARIDISAEQNDLTVGFHKTPQGVLYGQADQYDRPVGRDSALSDQESYDEMSIEISKEIDEELRRKNVK